MKKILNKEFFDIRDLATIVKKETQTIRSWEKKNIISKPEQKSIHGQKEWRKYSKEDLANTLQTILDYPWERKIIKNEKEIEYIIDFLHGKIDSLDGLLGDEDGDN